MLQNNLNFVHYYSTAQIVSPDVTDAKCEHRRHPRLPRQQALRRLPLDHAVWGHV